MNPRPRKHRSGRKIKVQNGECIHKDQRSTDSVAPFGSPGRPMTPPRIRHYLSSMNRKRYANIFFSLKERAEAYFLKQCGLGVIFSTWVLKCLSSPAPNGGGQTESCIKDQFNSEMIDSSK
jgi:hypothetical protein